MDRHSLKGFLFGAALSGMLMTAILISSATRIMDVMHASHLIDRRDDVPARTPITVAGTPAASVEASRSSAPDSASKTGANQMGEAADRDEALIGKRDAAAAIVSDALSGAVCAVGITPVKVNPLLQIANRRSVPLVAFYKGGDRDGGLTVHVGEVGSTEDAEVSEVPVKESRTAIRGLQRVRPALACAVVAVNATAVRDLIDDRDATAGIDLEAVLAMAVPSAVLMLWYRRPHARVAFRRWNALKANSRVRDAGKLDAGGDAWWLVGRLQRRGEVAGDPMPTPSRADRALWQQLTDRGVALEGSLEGSFADAAVAFQRAYYRAVGASPLVSTVCEIGFNAGHSAALWLSSNPEVRVVSWDLCEHRYTQPNAALLHSIYGARLNLTCGDSLQTVPDVAAAHASLRCDVIHIDGGHAEHVAAGDLHSMHAFAHAGTLLLMDDLACSGGHCEGPVKAWTAAIASHAILELRCFPLPTARGFCAGLYVE